jgi:hypothetical protein
VPVRCRERQTTLEGTVCGPQFWRNNFVMNNSFVSEKRINAFSTFDFDTSTSFCLPVSGLQTKFTFIIFRMWLHRLQGCNFCLKASSMQVSFNVYYENDMLSQCFAMNILCDLRHKKGLTCAKSDKCYTVKRPKITSTSYWSTGFYSLLKPVILIFFSLVNFALVTLQRQSALCFFINKRKLK